MAGASGGDQDLAEFLGSKAYGIFSLVAEARRQTRITETLRLAAEALALLDGFDLEQYEREDTATSDLSLWTSVEPAFQDLVAGVGSALGAMLILFPLRGPDAIELEFEPPVDQDGQPIDEFSGLDIDAVVRTVDSEHQESVAHAINSLVRMMMHDLGRCSDRLRSAYGLGDRWVLLAELQELKGKSIQCFEAIVATVFRGLTDVDLEDLFPRYHSSQKRALDLRAAFVALRNEVQPLNDLLVAAPPEDYARIHGLLLEALERLTSKPASRWMRAPDKHEVLRFHLFLRSWEKEGAVRIVLRQKVEGFSKLLDVFLLINRRAYLVKHDREVFRSAKRALSEPGGVAKALSLLASSAGRSDPVDALVRAAAEGEPVTPEQLEPLVLAVLHELG